MSATTTEKPTEGRHKLPKPVVKNLKWQPLLIWCVPLLALVAAGYYYLDYRSQHGEEITIKFANADGIKVGQTPLNHLGVEVGRVTDLQLSPDGGSALVKVQLQRSADEFANGGGVFWIARPEISGGSVSGLTTVISGPYIDCRPGTGQKITEFVGKDKAPVSLVDGLNILLHADRLEHLQRDSAIYFRGIQVGVVQGVELESQGNRVSIHAIIWRRYAPLVRPNSQFWLESGIDLSGGLFSGVKISMESLRALLSGGIAFATPDDKSPPAQDGDQFTLNPESKKEWLTWGPQLQIAPTISEDGDKESSPQPDQGTAINVKAH